MSVILDNPLRQRGFVAPAAPSPRWFHRRLPDYAVTPLHDLPGLAAELGIGRLLIKDESSRLGLPAFKMLGASWATYRALSERLGQAPAAWATIDDLRAAFAPLGDLTLATATDGNHGRALARMARLLGLTARIWVPDNTAPARIAAIEGEGATVLIASGGYDDAVAEAAASEDDRTIVVSDTSWPGYETVPAWVIEGYSTIFEEVDEQLVAMALADLDMVVIPIGVGAFAAAAARHYRTGEEAEPILAGVEPIDAACVLESAKAGRIVTLEGPQLSIMAGLNCGTPSPLAWPVVSRAYDLFVTVSDAAVVDAMRALNRAGIESGESGAAPLAAARQIKARSGQGLAATSLLMISTEGVTDPEFYAREVLGQVPAL